VQQPNNIQSFNRYSYVMNNPLNKTDPSGYIWATLISYALNYIATTYATSAIGTAIGYALTAYQFYGQFQLAKGVLNAIEGGGTAMANFAGGFAKSYVKGMIEGAVIAGLANKLSSSETQGNSNTESSNKDNSSAGSNRQNNKDDLYACNTCNPNFGPNANSDGVEMPEELETFLVTAKPGDNGIPSVSGRGPTQDWWEGEVEASAEDWELLDSKSMTLPLNDPVRIGPSVGQDFPNGRNSPIPKPGADYEVDWQLKKYTEKKYKIPLYTVQVTRHRLLTRARLSNVTNTTQVVAKWVYSADIVSTRYVEKTFIDWSPQSAKYRMKIPIPTGR